MATTRILSISIAFALAAGSGCGREIVSCADYPSPVCADAFTGMDTGPRADANRDAFSLFDAGIDGALPDAVVVPDATMCTPACGGETPVCVSMNLCGECGGDTDCAGNPDGNACNMATHQCVQCTATNATGCTGATAFCDPADNTCVGCRDATDCAGNLDACVGRACVGCDDRADCVDDVGLPACVSNTCRGCADSTDCGAAAAVCSATNTCALCTADADCTRLGATPVCDETRGACVACTGDTEAARCAMSSCRRSDGTCTTRRRGISGTCDSCEADSECITGLRCVRHTFAGTDTGSFCFFDASVGGCGDTNLTRRPYSTRALLSSIDGVAATYCMPPITTTCQGRRDTQSVVCTMDSECGVSALADGFCPSAGTGAGACTYQCSGGVDCGGPLNCGGSPQHCRPPL